jgi:hypothetical protein
MSESFKIIYRILSILEKSMDYPEFDPDSISAETLGVSEERWRLCIQMMADDGYITDVQIKSWIHEKIPHVDVSNIKITIKGLEYLQENNMMKKAYRVVKGIKDITPGLEILKHLNGCFFRGRKSMEIQPKLEIIYTGMGTNVILDGKDLMGVKRVSFEDQVGEESPTLILEFDLEEFGLWDKLNRIL